MNEKPHDLNHDLTFYCIQGVPHLRGFHYRGSHYRDFWLMYMQVGDFCVSRGCPIIPLTQISCNAGFFKSQNQRKVGPSVHRKEGSSVDIEIL